MSSLPDELWRRILELGIGICGFTYKDLCCISISCRRLHRLAGEDPLWNLLLSSDFPLSDKSSSNTFPTSSSSSSSSKSLYKFRFERDKERRLAAHRRALLRKESQIVEHSRKLRVIETRVAQETTKMRETVSELSNLRRVRQASVALNVWQPEVIRGRQKQMVEQCVVPAESRIHALEMELRLCKQQIKGLEKCYVSFDVFTCNMIYNINTNQVQWVVTYTKLCQKDEKCRLDTAKEELLSMMYRPVQEHKPVSGGENEHSFKRKKLKRCDNLQENEYKTP